jgi:hypothetical protein
MIWPNAKCSAKLQKNFREEIWVMRPNLGASGSSKLANEVQYVVP